MVNPLARVGVGVVVGVSVVFGARVRVGAGVWVGQLDVNSTHQLLGLVLGLANSMVNPLIYGAFHSCRCFRSSTTSTGVDHHPAVAKPPTRCVRIVTATYTIRIMHGSATFSTSGSSYFNGTRTTVLNLFCRMTNH